MPRALLRLVLAVVVALGVAALAPRLAHAQLLSPGPMSSAHANIDGDDDCGKCHESGKQVVARLCLDCHKDLGAKLSAGTGLHGKQYKSKPCEECHVEHLGKNGRLVRWPGGSPDKLDHDLTGWTLNGGHKPLGCVKCHTKTSPLGKVQYVGTKTACASCHKDPHTGRFSTDCKKCHSESDWKTFEQKAFDHNLAKFQLTGKHVDVACDKCHGTPRKWTGLSFTTCEACHADVHKGQFRPKPCSACHDVKGWESAGDKIRSDHPWLSLRNGHAAVACKACHDRGDDKPPSKGKTCVGCHKAVHVAKFGTQCESCHASIKWIGIDPQIGRDNHPKTLYPLAGKHATVECARCHVKSKPEAERYRGLRFDACLACHKDDHKGEFASRNKGECAQCHTVNGYTPTLFGINEHASTGFSLDGKHAATPCSGCHPGPRPRLSFALGEKQCLDCHDNPHGNQFALEMSKGGCAQCHTSYDWHQARIDHSKWPLVGAHKRTACAACHGEQKVGASPAAYRGVPRDCEGCHDDVHAGQFRQTAPIKACNVCHDPADKQGFKLGKQFDHTKNTSYELEGKHKTLACSECHIANGLRNGDSAVRYRLGYRACKDCHANPHREATP
jgi:hypothetical protein